MEISLTSGQFNADLFALANNRSFAPQAYDLYMTETVTIVNNKATLSHVAKAGTVSIAGLEEATTAAEGKFAVADVDATETVPAHTEITFVGEEGEIEISYEVTVDDAQVIEVDNKSTAIGSALFRWPVYGSSEDCTDSAIKGYLNMKVYRCRVTQMPGFDTSYKSAATNAVTFSAMDAKRADDAVYSLVYVPKSALD